MLEKKKVLIISMLVFIVLSIASVGAVIAYIAAFTGPVESTFTIGDITLKLEETTGSKYQLIPGETIKKDPKVTVGKGSEDCYLFVKLTKTGSPDLYLNYSIADGWLPLYGHDGIYYRTLTDIESDVTLSIITDDKLVVKDTLSKEVMQGILENPKLTFTAYAVQSYSIDSPEAAYHIILGEE